MNPDVLKDAVIRLERERNKANSARAIRQENDPNSVRMLRTLQIQREPQLRSAIDDACRHWISTDSWPIMDEDAAILVWERLNHGYLLGGYLHHKGGLRAEQKTLAEVLAFLLIDSWEVTGVHRLRSRLLDTP
jgi:hypothetical protein